MLQKPESIYLCRLRLCSWPACLHSPLDSAFKVVTAKLCSSPVFLRQPVSTVMPTPERSTPASSPAATALPSSQGVKSQRVLACVLCQQRKVKCNRKFPCANCIRSRTQCVPAATLARRQRRRRFPERELLDHIRRYESLLRQNNIEFEPLHKDPSTIEQQSPNANDDCGGYDSLDDERPQAASDADRPSSLLTTVKSESVNQAKYALAFKNITFLTIYSQELLARHESKGTAKLAHAFKLC